MSGSAKKMMVQLEKNMELPEGTLAPRMGEIKDALRNISKEAEQYS